MKRIIYVLPFFFFSFVQAQELSKQDKRNWENADIDYEIGDFRRAAEVYEDLYAKDTTISELELKLGISYFYLRQYDKSRDYLEKAKEHWQVEALYYLGQVYHLDGRLVEEIELYQSYKNYGKDIEQSIESVNRLIEQAKYAQELIDQPVNVDIENIGSEINTEYHEYVPLVYGEEDEIFFTSRRPGSTGGLQDHRGDYFEDVYNSQFRYGFWQRPDQLGEQINTPTNDACVGISADGQKLYIFRTSDDLISGDLYVSEKDEDGWGQLEMLGSDINSEYAETSASISSDDKILYFSSNREGGYGGMDIYRVVKMPNGEWSKAQNLGPTINTQYNEDSPFIHADNKTLYFISTGHKSMGGYDIFKSTLKPDGLWTEPVNMGYPINSLANDMNFVMAADKLSGYYSSSANGGFGGQDIYKIIFRLEAKILSVVKGGVLSDDTAHVPVMASVTLIDKRTKEVQGIYKSNASTGKFIMVITPESSYQVIVEADGYHTYSGELYFDATVGFGSTIEEFKLIPLEVVSNE